MLVDLGIIFGVMFGIGIAVCLVVDGIQYLWHKWGEMQDDD